jgi:hypothetical protein
MKVNDGFHGVKDGPITHRNWKRRKAFAQAMASVQRKTLPGAFYFRPSGQRGLK